MCLMKIEDEIELTNVSEVPVKAFDKMVDLLQCQELIVVVVNTRNEEKTCVPHSRVTLGTGAGLELVLIGQAHDTIQGDDTGPSKEADAGRT